MEDSIFPIEDSIITATQGKICALQLQNTYLIGRHSYSAFCLGIGP
jgi:hypothetical protein